MKPKVCFGNINSYGCDCEECWYSADCLYNTLINTSQKSQEKCKVIPNLYSLMFPEEYEGLGQGTFGTIEQEINEVTLLKIEDTDGYVLVKRSEIRPVYEVISLYEKNDDYEIRVFSDLFKRVIVNITIDGNAGKGTASCSPDDKFNLNHGFMLAKVRANMNIFAKLEAELMGI